MSNYFLDKDGNVVGPFDFNETLGRKAAALVRSFALSTEDLAAVNALATLITATNAALASALPLPTGAATSANQTTLNTAMATANTALAAIETAAQDTTTPSPVSVQTPADLIPFTPTLDTSVYASGDVLFATVALPGVTRANDLRATLMSLTVVDKSKQTPAFTIFFYKTNVTSAAANSANALSDADAVSYMGHVSIAAADYKTLANNSFLTYSGAKAPNLLLEAATGTTSVYMVGILDAGTPTFAAGDLQLGFGVVQS